MLSDTINASLMGVANLAGIRIQDLLKANRVPFMLKSLRFSDF